MSADATTMIMTSAVITTGVTLIAEQQDNKLSIKPVIAGWILGLFLFLIATWDDETAKMIAVLVMITALLVNGTKLFTTVSKVTGGKGFTPSVPNTPGSGGIGHAI